MSVVLIVTLSIVAILAAALLVWRQPVRAFAQRSAAFLRGVRSEVRKITWPSWDDLRRSTLIITILVIVIAVVIGVMDTLFSLILIRGLGQMIG